MNIPGNVIEAAAKAMWDRAWVGIRVRPAWEDAGREKVQTYREEAECALEAAFSAMGMTVETSTVVTWKAGGVDRTDHDASEHMRRIEDSPSAPAEWHNERRFIGPWFPLNAPEGK